MNNRLTRRELLDYGMPQTKPVMIIEPQEITLLDMNFSGAGIQTEMLLEVGTELSFDLLVSGMRYTLKAEVVWSRKIGKDYRSGLKLIDLPPDFAPTVEAMVHRMLRSQYNN